MTYRIAEILSLGKRIVIEENDYINDILNKVDKATYSLVRAYLPLIRKGVVIRKKQELNEGSFRRLRTDYDSLIGLGSKCSSNF